MLTIQQIKANPEEVISRLAVKGFDGNEPINKVLALDEERRKLQLENDTTAATLNKLSAQIGSMMKSGKKRKPRVSKHR